VRVLAGDIGGTKTALAVADVGPGSLVLTRTAIYPSADDLANPLFRGELLTGPGEIDYAVDPLEAGKYYFHCDVHPTMSGTVSVS